MRRMDDGETRRTNNALDTISAAATAIASAENRVPHASIQKRRWGGCWGLYWCFGSHKQRKRIGHAVLVPNLSVSGASAPAADNPTQAPSIVLPFVAPPSSPASFLQSEPQSAIQSPTGLLSLASISANMYSPGGTASMFAIGPYAHETQLVSPPVFSTFTTEPSTAPFTPPPESVHLTTPSSPEVPFACLLEPNHQNCEASQRFPVSHYEFQSYQLQPGSPVGHLISPSSGISGSGASSPFPDQEFILGHPHFLKFQTGDPPKLLDLDKLSPHKWGSRHGSVSRTPDAVDSRSRDSFLLDHQSSPGPLTPKAMGPLTPKVMVPIHINNVPLDCQNRDAAPLENLLNGWQSGGIVVDHRVSFEVTAEDVVRCVEKKPATHSKSVLAPTQDANCAAEINEFSGELVNGHECHPGETSDNASESGSSDGENGQRHQKHRSITLGSIKEFNFDNVNGGNADRPSVGSDWWANEKVMDNDNGPGKNWSFFPMIQPDVN